MRKTTIFLGTGLLTISLFTACGKKADVQSSPTSSAVVSQTPEEAITATPSSAESNKENETSELLNSLDLLIGEEDNKVIEVFGEGKANYNEGTKDIISREYSKKILDEDVMISVYYNDNKKMDSASIPLGDKDFEDYKKQLEEILGSVQDTVDKGKDDQEGNGKKSYRWSTDRSTITLLRAYDLNSIEIASI